MESFDFVEMRVPAKAEYVGVVRLSISGIASRMGFTYEDIEDLKVVISEAVTNTVEHAYDVEDEGEVTIGFGIYDNRLEVMVADHGGSFNLSEIKERTGRYTTAEEIENLRGGGFGLFIINELMDKVEINNEYGVIILMTKYLSNTEVELDGKISTK